MRDRKDILNDLVSYEGNLQKLQTELSNYSWDIEEPITTFSNIILLSVLKKCLHQEITISELEDWANVIECREDIAFDSVELQETIFDLANPKINGDITIVMLKKIIDSLTV